MELSDNTIVEQVREGERQAYAEIVTRYQKPVFNLMYRFCHSEQDSAELTQDVFCKAFEKLGSFQNGKSFFPWLYSLALNHGRDWLRKQERKRDGMRVYTDTQKQDGPLLPLEIVEKKQEDSTLLMALSCLSYENREILLLRYQQELSISELGEIFGLSKSAVKMRIHRALSLLRDDLSENYDVNK